MIKTDLSGFVVTVHSGFCQQYIQSRPNSLGIGLPVHKHPRALQQQTTSGPVFIP